MRRVRPALVFVVAGLLATNLFAASLNIGDLSTQADKIVRGEVVAINEGSVVSGGMTVPTINYLVRVDEVFKGDVQVYKGVPVVEIQSAMLKRLPGGNVIDLPRTPALQVGQTYLLFTSTPSAEGLTSMVGDGQGVFHVERTTVGQPTINQSKNLNLFSGLAGVDGSSVGAVPYGELAEHVRAALGQ